MDLLKVTTLILESFTAVIVQQFKSLPIYGNKLISYIVLGFDTISTYIEAYNFFMEIADWKKSDMGMDMKMNSKDNDMKMAVAMNMGSHVNKMH